jgi:hypothetical protein
MAYCRTISTPRFEGDDHDQEVTVVENGWAFDAVRLGPIGGDGHLSPRTLAPVVDPAH